MAYSIKTKKRKIRYSDYQLPIEQAVYIPTTDKYQKEVSKEKVMQRVNEIETYMSNLFGGYTEVKSEGGYVMKEGEHKSKLIREPVIKVTSFSTTKAYKKNKGLFLMKLRKWGKEWGQESIGYEHEGDLTYLQSEVEE